MAKTIYSQDAGKYVLALAEKLKQVPEFEVPEWANYVKSGSSRERPPVQTDFWYVRAASILRQLYIKGVVGVGKLRTRYGSRKDRGTMPDEFRKGGGKIIRTILQQAEKAGLVEKVERLQFGRRLTQTGRDFLDSIEVPIEGGIDWSGVLVHKAISEEVEEDIQEDASESEDENDEEEDEIRSMPLVDDEDEESDEGEEEEKDGK